MPSNRLINEKSPYLLQHAHNPVDWYAWGEDAFAKARAEDKPIFLSVGYSTCHWCHVMERESFENEQTAAILNHHFVPVKVDREERPDVDRIYMMFVQATTGSGGWPMSVWLTPALKPFYGGTYFPPDSRYGRPGFAFLLEQIANAWQTQRGKIEESGEAILAQLAQATDIRAGVDVLNPGALDAAFHYFRRTFDKDLGGFGGAPKFPRPSVLNFLLRYSRLRQSDEALEMALLTLREMARGGMNDQLGGGFHRYSVDERWFVPHFEKMLYDQAQLAVSYLEAFQVTGDSQYADIAREIFEYVLRDLSNEEGGFFSAEDADSIVNPEHPHEKGEGAFYVWSCDEIDHILGEEWGQWFAHRYGCEENGNVFNDPHREFAEKNILYEANSLKETARRFDVDESAMALAFETMSTRLLAARSTRPRPHLDDKVLTAWNGLMISALARGGIILGEQRYLNAALRAATFVFTNLYDESCGLLYRRWREGERAIEGFLDDYASFANALIDLYEATFEARHLADAQRICGKMLELFEDRENGAFYSTAAGEKDLVLRLKEDYDGAEPSGNSLAIGALLRLAAYTGDNALAEAGTKALRAFSTRLLEQSPTVPQMLCAWMRELAPKSQIVIAGPPDREDTAAMLAEVRRRFLPDAAVFLLPPGEGREEIVRWNPAIAAMSEVDGRAAAFVCENFSCQLPVTSVDDLAKLLD